MRSTGWAQEPFIGEHQGTEKISSTKIGARLRLLFAEKQAHRNPLKIEMGP
jgi:hypothetical protein